MASRSSRWIGPGFGLSDSVDLTRVRCREAAVEWLHRLLDTLGFNEVTLLGHSMGGVWSIWYSLAYEERVERLVLMGGPPLLPGSRSPWRWRLTATPALRELLQALPANRSSAVQFARSVGEGDSMPEFPDLYDLLVAIGYG